MTTYKHFSAKSTLESWLVANPIAYVEEHWIPAILSPNSVTLIGQIPLQIMAFFLLWWTGGNIDASNPPPAALLVFGGFLIEWFSQIDMMDGQRARRCKAGSPLGRIVDEAGDCLVMAHYSLLLAYIFGFRNEWLELIFFFMQIGFFGMEVQHKVCGHLVMV